MAPGKCHKVRLIVSFITMLTLDRSTLFYWCLTSDQPGYGFSVDSWAQSVPKNAKPPSQAAIRSRAPTVKDTATVPGVPSLTYGSSHLTGGSVLTDSITIISKMAPSIVKSEQNLDVVETKPKFEKTSESSTSSSKRPKNSDLPKGIDLKVWRRVFVPTFMRWVSQQENPFEHNVKLGCSAMQKIWDSIFHDVPCTITQSSPVYGLVSRDFYPILYSTSSYMIDRATCIWFLAQHHRLSSNCYYTCLLQFQPGAEGLWW